MLGEHSPNLSAMNRLSSELLDRLSKECGRAPTTAGTELVGGIVKAGGKLEDVLQEVVRVIAGFEGCPPQHMFSNESPGGRAVDLTRATAGALARGLRRWYEREGLERAPVFARPLVADLLAKRSAIHAFISLRNAVTHAEADPKKAGPVTLDLARVVEAFRAANGWR